MRPFVKSIYSNLKSPRPCGDAWSVELGQHTLLVGTNTSHKSSVIQSVELALAGSADDIFGRRAVSDAALLMTLAPADELGVSAVLSDEEHALFNVQREAGKVKRPQHKGPGKSALVHRMVSEALAGSTANARKAFLSWAGGDIQLEDVLAHLPAELHAKYRDIADHKSHGNTPVETLLEIVAYSSKRQREASKEAKGAQIILESMGDTVEDRPSEDDLARIRIAVVEARKVLDVAVNAAGAGMTAEARSDAIAEAANGYNQWENHRLQAERSLQETETSLPQKGENVGHAIQIVDVAVKHSLDACPVCSSQVGLDHLKNCQAFYQEQENQWQAQSSQTLMALDKWKSNLESAERHVAQFRNEVERLKQVPVIDGDATTISVADAQSRLEAATAALTAAETIQSQWENLANARDRMFSMHAEANTYKDLKKCGETAVGRLLAEQAKDFSQRVQKYLPKHWDFNIELLDGDREVFRMGVMRDGRLHSALSGAEWASVVCAISMAVSESLPDNEPAVLIPEDRAWDGKTLSAVMKGFSKFEGQVIMASTIRPTGRPPKGWTILDMDTVSADWCEPDEEYEVDEVEEKEEPTQTSKNHASGGLRVTSRSTLMLEEMGFDPCHVDMMSRDTVAAIIRDGLSPDVVCVNENGTYDIVRGGNVLPMPPAPKA